MSKTELIDRYNRNHTYLRVSITDRCNLHCLYCESRKVVLKSDPEEILTYEEILRLIRIGVDLSMTKIRITGGEPFIRKDVDLFLHRLGRIKGLTDVSLTTNGVLLSEHFDALRIAGIRRVNISLDTLSAKTYKTITGRDHFDRVWKGILAARDLGFSPVKLNIVALNGINNEALEDFARLSFQYPFHFRFIEHMPFQSHLLPADRPLLSSQIKQRLSQIGRLLPVKRSRMDGPAKRYRFEGAAGEIGLISPVSEPFCNECNRLRLTAAGRLMTCLMGGYQADLKTPLRQGASDTKLASIIQKAIRQKSRRPDPGKLEPSNTKGPMSAIGG